MTNNPKLIAKAFFSKIPTEENWYKTRLKICEECPKNSKNGAELSVLQSITQRTACYKGFETPETDDENKKLPPVCSSCGCCILVKVGSLESECPLKKWGKVTTTPSKEKISVVIDNPNHTVDLENNQFIINLGEVEGPVTDINLKFITPKKFEYYDTNVGCSCVHPTFTDKEEVGVFPMHYRISLKGMKGDIARTSETTFYDGKTRKLVKIKFKFFVL